MIHCVDEIQADLKKMKQAPLYADSAVKQEIDECLENAVTIAHCALHQKSIVDDILTVSKLDSNLLVIVPSPVQPFDFTRQALKM